MRAPDRHKVLIRLHLLIRGNMIRKAVQYELHRILAAFAAIFKKRLLKNLLFGFECLLRRKNERPVLEGMSGLSARAIASELTIRGIPTARGTAWSAKTVLRVMDRLRIAAQ